MALLEVRGLCAAYGDLQAVGPIDFDVQDGEAVALVGANGAGKSTLLKTLCGLMPPTTGSILFTDIDVATLPANQAAQRMASAGIALVPEGRMMFASLTVEENLLMGASTKRAGFWNLARVYELFPALQDKRQQNAMRLSGGQQQMVAIGRALMSNPKLLLCDEISLGLAPAIVEQVYAALARIRSQGLALVLVEQDIARASRECTRLYCLLKGRVALHGACGQFDSSTIAKAYFG